MRGDVSVSGAGVGVKGAKGVGFGVFCLHALENELQNMIPILLTNTRAQSFFSFFVVVDDHLRQESETGPWVQ